jgi:predicted  nucleic acid-binding Zn-ribbon protein
MSQVNLLFRLQELDDRLRAEKKRLGDVLRLQNESEQLVAARRQAEAAGAEYQKWNRTQNSLSLEVKGLTQKAKRSEDRLYSGTVKNPKELTDIQQEIDSLHRRRSLLEDELLEAMIQLEEAQEEVSNATASFERIKTKWEKDQQSLREEQSQLLTRIQGDTVQRKELTGRITPQNLAAYESTAHRTGKIAVVELSNGRCRGCQVRVPANLVKAADEGNLVYCDSCGRILCPV